MIPAPACKFPQRRPRHWEAEMSHPSCTHVFQSPNHRILECKRCFFYTMESREGCCVTMVTRPSLERHQSKIWKSFCHLIFFLISQVWWHILVILGLGRLSRQTTSLRLAWAIWLFFKHIVSKIITCK